ncbi:MAG: hypothetical protein ACKVZJ_01405 [Phycisphaerales bacterium]
MSNRSRWIVGTLQCRHHRERGGMDGTEHRGVGREQSFGDEQAAGMACCSGKVAAVATVMASARCIGCKDVVRIEVESVGVPGVASGTIAPADIPARAPAPAPAPRVGVKRTGLATSNGGLGVETVAEDIDEEVAAGAETENWGDGRGHGRAARLPSSGTGVP